MSPSPRSCCPNTPRGRAGTGSATSHCRSSPGRDTGLSSRRWHRGRAPGTSTGGAGSYLCVAVGDQGDVEDVVGQHQPRGEELLHQEPAARRAQALVEQAQLHGGGRRARAVGAAALGLRAGGFWGAQGPQYLQGTGAKLLGCGCTGLGREARAAAVAAGSCALPTRRWGFPRELPQNIFGENRSGAAGTCLGGGAGVVAAPPRALPDPPWQQRHRPGWDKPKRWFYAEKAAGDGLGVSAAPRCQRGTGSPGIPATRRPVPQGCSAPGTVGDVPTPSVPACRVALPRVGRGPRWL